MPSASKPAEFRYSSLLENIRPSASIALGLDGGGEGVLNLAVGLPDLAPPAETVALAEAAARALAFSKYWPSKGSLKALENLKAASFSGEEIQADRELMLVSGCKYGVYLALKTAASPGDSVLLMEPYWLSYPYICAALGLKTRTWSPEIDGSGRLEFSLAALEKQLADGRVRAVVINQPNNPAGHVFSQNFLHELQERLSARGVWLILDEVYRELAFDKRAPSLPVRGTGVVRVNSFSKSLSSPGLRLGWIAADADFIAKANLFNQHLMTCVSGAAHHFMENFPPALLASYSRQAAATYAERTAIARAQLYAKGIRSLQSSAAFYLLADFSKRAATGSEACALVRRQAAIQATPGEEYGPLFKGWVRFCLVADSRKIGDHFARLEGL